MKLCVSVPLWFPLFLLSLLVTGSNAVAETDSAGELSDAIVARVNGRPILLSQLKEAALDLQIPLSALTSEGLQGEGFRKAITAQVDDELLLQAAQAEGIAPDETESARRVDLQIQKLIQNLGGPDGWMKFLKRAHLSVDALRRMLLAREKRQDLITAYIASRVKVSGEEIEEFKRHRQEEGKSSEEVLAAQIFIRCPKEDQSTPLGKQLYGKALKISKEAGGTPTKFGDLARKNSDDAATRERSGVLGWLDPKSLQEPLGEKLAAMDENQISEPITTAQGYHIVYVVDRHSARELFFAEKFEQERQKMIETLRGQAKIEIYPLK